jgi:hypothetical protein
MSSSDDPLAAARAEVESRLDALSRAFQAVEEARDLVKRLEAGDDPAEPINLMAATISTSEAAERCGVSIDTIVRWARDDGVGYKHAGRWRIHPKKLHALRL